MVASEQVTRSGLWWEGDEAGGGRTNGAQRGQAEAGAAGAFLRGKEKGRGTSGLLPGEVGYL